MKSHFLRQGQELALAVIATRERREADHLRITALIEAVDFPSLETVTRPQGMLSLVGRRVCELGACVPPTFVAHIESYRRQAQVQCVEQEMITVRLLAALESAGILAMPLKGPILGRRIYGQIDARVSADIDLLVAARDLPRALATLKEFGYRGPNASTPSTLPELHESMFSSTGLPEVELHWRIHWYEERFSAAMLERSVTDGEGSRQPQPPDELIMLLLLYARDGMAGLRLLADIAGWWDRFGGSLDITALNRHVLAYPRNVRALATAALTAERLAGLPATRILSREILTTASPRALGLTSWSQRGGKAQGAANMALIDLSLCPRGQRTSLVRRHLWLRRRPDSRGQTELIRDRVLHPVRIGRRCAAALWRVHTAGDWDPPPDRAICSSASD